MVWSWTSAASSPRTFSPPCRPSACAKAGVDDRGLLARALADLRPRELVLDLVARVRAEGIRAAVLSNSLGRGGHDPYQGYDLCRRFDAVVLSDQVGLRKPDPAIYRLAASKLGVARAPSGF